MGTLVYSTLYNSWFSLNMFQGIYANLNLRIQALKLYIYYYIDLYLKDDVLVLLWGAWK